MYCNKKEANEIFDKYLKGDIESMCWLVSQIARGVHGRYNYKGMELDDFIQHSIMNILSKDLETIVDRNKSVFNYLTTIIINEHSAIFRKKKNGDATYHKLFEKNLNDGKYGDRNKLRNIFGN